MGVKILIDTQVKPEDASNIKSFLSEILPDTWAYDGCNEVEVYLNTEDNSNLIIVADWESREHHEKYLAWRKETGVLDKFGSMLTRPADTRYFEKTDI
jgi:quinol monooxygenase YgiN